VTLLQGNMYFSYRYYCQTEEIVLWIS